MIDLPQIADSLSDNDFWRVTKVFTFLRLDYFQGVMVFSQIFRIPFNRTETPRPRVSTANHGYGSRQASLRDGLAFRRVIRPIPKSCGAF